MPDPTVRAPAALVKIDELVARAASLLEEIRAVTEPTSPGAGPVVPNAITVASVMVDEIRLRAQDFCRHWCREAGSL